MSTRAVLVIVTLPKGSCGHCDEYIANQHQKLMELVRNDGRIIVQHFSAQNPKGLVPYNASNHDSSSRTKGSVTSPKSTQPSVNASSGNSSGQATYHPELLTTYWKWWPTFMVFTKDSWANHSSPLVGYVMGGRIVNKPADNGTGKIIRTIEEVPEEYKPYAEGIMEWVINALNTNAFDQKVFKSRNYSLDDNNWTQSSNRVRMMKKSGPWM